MLIGIVSERRRKDGVRLARLFGGKRAVRIESDKNPFEICVLELPVNESSIQRISDRRAEKMLCNAVRELRALGAEYIIYSESVKRWFMSERAKKELERAKTELFLRLVLDDIENLAKKCKVELIDAVLCISCTKMDRLSWYFADRLCFKVREIVFLTTRDADFEARYDKFAAESGYYPKVIEYGEGKVQSSDILIDFDGKFVRIGRDVKLCGVGYDLDIYGYSVDCADIAACVYGAVREKSGMYFVYGKM